MDPNFAKNAKIYMELMTPFKRLDIESDFVINECLTVVPLKTTDKGGGLFLK